MRYGVQILAASAAITLIAASAAMAAPLVPGPADSGRIEHSVPLQPLAPSASMPETGRPAALVAPDGAEQIRFTLKGLAVEGATALSDEQLRAVYASRLGTTVSLADIYAMASAIQHHYLARGFFLTQVLVPDQQIVDGKVTIRMVEGYIAKTTLEGPLAQQSVVQGYLARIRSERPLTSATLERALLQLNDLPGQTFRAVLSAAASGEVGASELTLIPQNMAPDFTVEANNFGSRFLGPQQLSAMAEASLLPLQQTTLHGLLSMPTRELGYGMLRHRAMVMLDMSLQGEVGVTRARPGYTLDALDVDSTATYANLGLRYQWLRQRQENLATSLTIEGRRVRGDIAGATLTHEDLRVMRFSADADMVDAWNGANVANVTLSQGIHGVGASDSGDANLSRNEAEPDFSKLEMRLSRVQPIAANWSAVLQLTGQVASGPLYSSEEFGFGGQNFGRAYDASELVGDHGAAGAVELRYEGWREWQPINLQPFAFYDYGVVINEDAGQSKNVSAGSMGAGLRFATDAGQVGQVGVAIPIGHDRLAPLYGERTSSPRLMMQIQQSF